MSDTAQQILAPTSPVCSWNPRLDNELRVATPRHPLCLGR
jgi:hypothetical protein